MIGGQNGFAAIINEQYNVATTDVVANLHKIFSVVRTRSTTAIMRGGRSTSTIEIARAERVVQAY